MKKNNVLYILEIQHDLQLKYYFYEIFLLIHLIVSLNLYQLIIHKVHLGFHIEEPIVRIDVLLQKHYLDVLHLCMLFWRKSNLV